MEHGETVPPDISNKISYQRLWPTFRAFLRDVGVAIWAVVGSTAVSILGLALWNWPETVLYIVLGVGLIVGPFLAYHRQAKRNVDYQNDILDHLGALQATERERLEELAKAREERSEAYKHSNSMHELWSGERAKNLDISDRHSKLIEEARELRKAWNRQVMRGDLAEVVTDEMRLAWRHRGARIELMALILEGESINGFSGFLVNGWIKKVDEFAIAAFDQALFEEFEEMRDPRGLKHEFERLHRVIDALKVAFDKFTAARMDHRYGRK